MWAMETSDRKSLAETQVLDGAIAMLHVAKLARESRPTASRLRQSSSYWEASKEDKSAPGNLYVNSRVNREVIECVVIMCIFITTLPLLENLYSSVVIGSASFMACPLPLKLAMDLLTGHKSDVSVTLLQTFGGVAVSFALFLQLRNVIT